MQTKQFALVNTFNAIPGGGSIGTLVSLHYTARAASEANRRFQKRVKKANGPNSYIPVCIGILAKSVKKGEHIGAGDLSPIDWSAQAEVE